MGSISVMWRLTGKYLEYFLVKPRVDLSFHPIPKGESVPLKCWQRTKGLTASDYASRDEPWKKWRSAGAGDLSDHGTFDKLE